MSYVTRGRFNYWHRLKVGWLQVQLSIRMVRSALHAAQRRLSERNQRADLRPWPLHQSTRSRAWLHLPLRTGKSPGIMQIDLAFSIISSGRNCWLMDRDGRRTESMPDAQSTSTNVTTPFRSVRLIRASSASTYREDSRAARARQVTPSSINRRNL